MRTYSDIVHILCDFLTVYFTTVLGPPSLLLFIEAILGPQEFAVKLSERREWSPLTSHLPHRRPCYIHEPHELGPTNE
jgi:hypothetical protein